MAGNGHVVWDWNGTLVDDLGVVVDSVNVALDAAGGAPIDADTYRDLYVRPVRLFYERLLDRPVSASEWKLIDDRFHRSYSASLPRVRLTSDAGAAIALLAGEGWSQSILSMWWHEELVPFVESTGLHDAMVSVRGNRHDAGAGKAEHLAEHLDVLCLQPSLVIAIGDALDDAVAARAVGCRCVLYDGGSHHRSELDSAGVPVASSLVEAVELAVASA